jgi:peptide/nickel transport system permease protein
MGTTIYGEDMLSRMIHASRVALTIGIIATSISVIIGVVAGGLMGYFAGWVDLLGMRLTEIIETIPRLILLLIITVSFGRSIYLMMTVIGLVSWTANARFIRAEFLRLRKLDFVQAGIAAGLPLRSILFRHMLPNGIAPVLVESSFSIAGAILLESTLSFLGLGLAPEDPSWGQLLNQARSGGTGFNWWIATFPGAAIFLTVFAYILVGEAMRDALDPKLRKQE